MMKVKKPKGGNYSQECTLHPNGVVFCKSHPQIEYCAECAPGCFYCTRTVFAKNPRPPVRKVAMKRSRPARVQPEGPKIVVVKASEVRPGDRIEKCNPKDPSEVVVVTIREVRKVRIRVTGGNGFLILHEPAFYVGSFTIKASEDVAIVERTG
jgi:hypothetical protein